MALRCRFEYRLLVETRQQVSMTLWCTPPAAHPSWAVHSSPPSLPQVMFDFIGKAMVLQPADSHTFAAREGDHPLLPPGPGLYVVREPTPFNTVAATLRRDAGYVRQAVHQAICNLASPPLPGPPSVLVPLAPAKLSARATAKAAKAQQPCRAVHSARCVLLSCAVLCT